MIYNFRNFNYCLSSDTFPVSSLKKKKNPKPYINKSIIYLKIVLLALDRESLEVKGRS